MQHRGDRFGFELARLSAAHADRVREMTFASYRHLLRLERSLRHPALGGTDLVDPFGFVALDGDTPIGLALAEAPVDRVREAQLLSVFVLPEARRRGIAEALVGLSETEARERGYRRLEAVFTMGKPGVESFVRIARRRGWSEPEPTCLVVHLKPIEALTSPLFEARARRLFSRGIEVFPWSELSAAEERELRRSNAERRWIEPALEPWTFPTGNLDGSSVGARHRGSVVGWILNHRLTPGLVRISAGFMRGDLARRGKVVPLLYETLRRVETRATDDLCSFITTFSYPSMIAFVRKRVAPVSCFVGESRKTAQELLCRPLDRSQGLQ